MTPNPLAPVDLADTTVLVTGATSGIGRATAVALAARGARLLLGVRDVPRGESLAADLPTAGAAHTVRHLDLADLASVARFAADTPERIDVLVNNAGVSSPELRRTADGFELQFGTNHLGHFALTNLLLPQITGRVVTVASQAERMARLDFDDLDWSRRPYHGGRAYADSKLANLLFTSELERRLRVAKSPVRAMAAHPGLVVTGMYGPAKPRRGLNLGRRLLELVGQDVDHGALPVLFAITAELPGDTFTGPEHLMHMRGGAQVIGRSKRAEDGALAARLWAVSEQLTDSALEPQRG